VVKSRKSHYRDALLHAMRSGRPKMFWRLLQAGYVANEARRLHIEHLHAQFANRPTSVACLASRMTGIPFSFTAHATDIFKTNVDRRALAQKIEAAKFVVTVSEFNRRYLEQVTPVPDGKIIRIHNGIDLNRFSPNGVPAPQPLRMLTVARLVEKKGLPVLIDACRRLRDAGIEFRCDIIGKGRLRPALREQIKEAGLGKTVHLVGPKTQREVLRYYHAAYLYVLPCVVGSDGNREGLPVSIVEALACGLPVITTPVTGIPEVVEDGKNGFLVPSGDAVALADAITKVVEDPALYQRLCDNARPSVAADFDREETGAALHRLLGGHAG
jgi:glycosyltransferase involved in cell wall biosynthesis